MITGLEYSTFLDADLGLHVAERELRLPNGGYMLLIGIAQGTSCFASLGDDPFVEIALPSQAYQIDLKSNLLEAPQLEGIEEISWDPDDTTDFLYVRLKDRPTRDEAREHCFSIARVLQFMGHSGLVPTGISPCWDVSMYFGHRKDASYWHHEESGKVVICTEPYDPTPELEADYDSWAKAFRYRVLKPKWPGMHRHAGRTRLYCFIPIEGGGENPSELYGVMISALHALATAPGPVWDVGLAAEEEQCAIGALLS